MKKHVYLVLGLLLLLSILAVSCESELQIQNVKDEASLKNAIGKGAKLIALSDDIVITSPIVIDGDKKITLDMNGKTISNTEDLWDDNVNDWSLVSVRDNASLTVRGNGVFKAKENDCYALDVQDEGADLTIENGTFIGNMHAVYVESGSLSVKGGMYSIQQEFPDASKAYGYVLNCLDQNWTAGIARIAVSDGTFIKFNPADCVAEGAHTNFLASGYKTVQNGDEYTVVKE